MSWLVTPQLKVLNGVTQESILGIPFGGGYFAGYISHTADGNPTHALIVAPRATGATGTNYTLTTNLKWADETVAVPASSTLIGVSSVFDGKANTDLMMSLIADETYSAGAFPAAQFCADLSIGGFTDWYLPAVWELDIAYFNLKPSTSANNTASGANPYSVPIRTNFYSEAYPAQTYLTDFATSVEGFVAALHWASTELNATAGAFVQFGNGRQTGVSSSKSSSQRLRAFRRIAL